MRIFGETKTFVHPIEDRTVANHFCPNCGGTVLWEASKRQGIIAVAVGMFGDPSFSPPARSIHEDTKHHWIGFSTAMDIRVERTSLSHLFILSPRALRRR